MDAGEILSVLDELLGSTTFSQLRIHLGHNHDQLEWSYKNPDGSHNCGRAATAREVLEDIAASVTKHPVHEHRFARETVMMSDPATELDDDMLELLG